MNDAISQLQKRGKKKSTLEQLLLVDHSNIYFENERLAEKLAKYLDELQKEQHNLLMQHDAERRELEEHIESLRSMKKISTEKTQQLLRHFDTISGNYTSPPKPELKIRPHTTGSLHIKRSRAQPEEREKEKPKDKNKLRSHSDNEDDGSEARDRKKEKRKKLPSDKENEEQEGDLKQKEKKYPPYYYNTVIQADDSCLKRVRNEFRRMLTAPNIRLSKEKDRMKKQKPHTATGSRKSSSVAITEMESEDRDGESGMKLICNRRSRPVMMSLRQMKELTNLDSESDAMTRRHREKIERFLTENRRKFEVLTVQMKNFIKRIDEKIKQDTEDSKLKVEELVDQDDIYFGMVPPDQIPQ